MPYLQKFVEFSVANCIVCLNRRDKPRHKTKIERSVYSGQPLETIYIDHIGPFTPTKFRGKNCAYILIIVDAYSRFTITYPVPDCSASTVIDQLVEEFIPSHGFFNRIVSDRGTAFTSKVFNEVMEQSGVLKYHIPPRNPDTGTCKKQPLGICRNGARCRISTTGRCRVSRCCGKYRAVILCALKLSWHQPPPRGGVKLPLDLQNRLLLGCWLC